MSATGGAPQKGVSMSGLVLFTLRVAAMALLLLACLALHLLWQLTRVPSPWPRRFLSGVGRIAGVRARIVGHRPEGNLFLLANHVSWIDIPAIAAASGAAFVGHDGLASMPVLRWLCKMNDTVLVARHDRRSVAQQVEQVRTAFADLGALAIFPEGTTSDGTGLLPFKSSLLSALDPLTPGISVVPVWLDYGTQSAEIAWVGEEHGFVNFRRILSRSRVVVLRVHFLAPLAGGDLAGRKAIAQAARKAILRAMGQID